MAADSQLVTSITELSGLVDRIVTGGRAFGFDIETGYHGPDREKFSIHPETALIAGISFTDSLEWARYAPLGHDRYDNLDNRQAARLLWKLLNTGMGVAHNAAFELRHLARFFRDTLADDPLLGEAVRESRGYFPIRSDSMIEAYLAADLPKFGLKPLTRIMFDRQGNLVPSELWIARYKELEAISRIDTVEDKAAADAAFNGYKMTEFYDLFEGLAVKQRKMLRFNVLELTPKVVSYACEDSVFCLAIHRHYYEQVKDRGLYAIEMGIVEHCIPAMEDFGVRYDWHTMRRAHATVRSFRDRYNADIMRRLTELTGRPTAINLGSPPQLARTLFDTLGYRTTVYTDATRDLAPELRKMSTGKIALAALAKKHPVVQMIRNWREMKRLEGTYLEKYEALYNYAPDGHTHPNHLSAAVVTGRFAVADPPYQQCVPGSYQVLTQTGWVRLDELSDGVPVAQYHENQNIDFVIPEVVRSPYAGPMVRLDGAESGTWQYTPNHRMVYRNRQPRGDRALGQIKECTAGRWADDLARKNDNILGRRFTDRYLPNAGYTTSRQQLDATELMSLVLAVVCQADGSRTRGNQYDIIVHRERKLFALRRLGLRPEQQSGGRWRVRVPVSAVERFLDTDKNFRPEAILTLSTDLLRAFLVEVMRWDGDSTRGATFGQKNSRRKSVEVVQAAAVLCGFATSIYERPEYDSVTVNIHSRAHRGAGRQDIGEVVASGMVFCVTVPTGMFVCRNDEGYVQVTGNSPKDYHYDLQVAKEAHDRHAEEHGGDCECKDFDPPPGTCFKFNFRDMIIAPPEHYILGFDLSQAELRAIAGEAQEPALLKAFAEGTDVHTLTAALMLGIEPEQVTKKQRDTGKTMNFALLYGMKEKSLADRLGVTLEEAEKLYRAYFRVYSRIAAWAEKQVEIGRRQGYVTSKFGRKLPIWEYHDDRRWIQAKGDRACVNYPIQGSATGDFVKIAMLRAHHTLKKNGLLDRVRLVMNIHDALEFYVHRSLQPQDVIAILQPAVIFPVPGWPDMKADWHFCKRLGSPIKIELTDDGRFIAHAGVEIELKPTLDIDRETGDLIEALPDITPEDVREFLDAQPAGVTDHCGQPEAGASVSDAERGHLAPGESPRFVHLKESRHLIIEVTDMPTADGYLRFTQLCDSHPGPHTLTLRTPEGDLSFEATVGFVPDDLARISFALGPARMYYDSADVDPDLFADLEL